MGGEKRGRQRKTQTEKNPITFSSGVFTQDLEALSCKSWPSTDYWNQHPIKSHYNSQGKMDFLARGKRWVIPSCAQGLLQALCSRIIPGRTQQTLLGARYWTQPCARQAPSLYNHFGSPLIFSLEHTYGHKRMEAISLDAKDTCSRHCSHTRCKCHSQGGMWQKQRDKWLVANVKSPDTEQAPGPEKEWEQAWELPSCPNSRPSVQTWTVSGCLFRKEMFAVLTGTSWGPYSRGPRYPVSNCLEPVSLAYFNIMQ